MFHAVNVLAADLNYLLFLLRINAINTSDDLYDRTVQIIYCSY